MSGGQTGIERQRKDVKTKPKQSSRAIEREGECTDLFSPYFPGNSVQFIFPCKFWQNPQAVHNWQRQVELRAASQFAKFARIVNKINSNEHFYIFNSWKFMEIHNKFTQFSTKCSTSLLQCKCCKLRRLLAAQTLELLKALIEFHEQNLYYICGQT